MDCAGRVYHVTREQCAAESIRVVCIIIGSNQGVATVMVNMYVSSTPTVSYVTDQSTFRFRGSNVCT